MARAEEILIQSILELLVKEPEGLEVEEVVERLGAGDGVVSPRGVRNLLNRLAKEGKLFKHKRWRQGQQGKPRYAYLLPDAIPRQLTLFDDIPGIEKYNLQTKTDVEKGELEPDELERYSVLERIAASHLHEEAYARAIINIAPRLAVENPIDLVINMACWVVDDLNRKGEQIKHKLDSGEVEVARQLAVKMDSQLGWVRRYFQLFWRLDRPVGEIAGILDLPRQAKHFSRDRKRAHLNVDKARERLQKRIFGDKLIEERVLVTNLPKEATGTDASVADIFLTHSPGSFIPPHPVVVTTSASALVTRSENIIGEYQNFDISPDQLREYEDYTAAEKGLVLAPELMQSIGKDRFKHSRMAALELRQYSADLLIAMEEAKWRPIGDAPELGIKPRPNLIFRDGRVFPLVHRLGDYEDDGLYGQIVRNQIKQFVKVIHNTLSNPTAEVVYGAAVKNPNMSWLAPLVFWYLHINKVQVEGRVVVKADDVYKAPFADTAVSHLLFLGLAKQSSHFAQNRLFVSCRVLRRFSDIAVVDSSLPVVIDSEQGQPELLKENNLADWRNFISQHIKNKQEHHQENILDESEYGSFIYLCAKVGVSMCYAAPTSAYELTGSGESGGAGHFLIPRLEVALDLERVERQLDYPQNTLDKMLSWLASGRWVLDHAHTQSGYETGEPQHSLPILIPDVTQLAHEAATFARNKLGEEVQDEIRKLIADLRRRMGKGR